MTPAGKGVTGGVNSAPVQAGEVFASIIGGVIIGTVGYRWLAAFLVWRVVSVDAGNAMEIVMDSPVAADARPDPTDQPAIGNRQNL